jgi:hypothetical protein
MNKVSAKPMALESIRKSKKYLCDCPDYPVKGQYTIPDLAKLHDMSIDELQKVGIKHIDYSEGDMEVCDIKVVMNDG